MSSLFFGAIAGFTEASICHPLDTIKTRMQNRQGIEKIGIFKTFQKIYYKEGYRGFYHGLTAVYSGVIPKNAVRFYSFEKAKEWTGNNFISGLFAGAIEAILVVNPTDVCKIRIQSQYNSIRDSTNVKYKSIYQTFYTIASQEGILPFYRGLIPTILRQSINQATNFFTFHTIKNNFDISPFIIGAFSGSLGPILNNPIDVIKTRMQSSVIKVSILQITRTIYAKDGFRGFYKGLGARLLRIIPGQSITFGVYEFLKNYKK
jgi:solute carrier family 25 citrate transporter 1